MKFVSVRDLRNHPTKVWKEMGRQKEIVVTSNGKPFAILSPTSEEGLESSLSSLRQARALQAMEAIQKESLLKKKDKTTLQEINQEIKAVRQKFRP